MALQGNLKELRLGDVLQTILTSGHRGVLSVRSGPRRARLQVAVDGLHLLEPDVLDEKMVLQGFVARGMVKPEIAERLKAGDAGSIIDGLTNGGSVSAGDVDLMLREAAEDHALEMFSWTDGDFRFEDGLEPVGNRGPVAGIALEPGSLLLMTAQRMDERREVTERLGEDPHLVLTVKDAPAGTFVEPIPERVLKHLDGKKLLDEIALQEGIGLFAAQRAALALVVAGLARAPEPAEMASEARRREHTGDTRSAMRLLHQWHSARPKEPEPLAALAALAARIGRHEEESDAKKTLGRILVATGQHAAAKDLYQRLLSNRPGDRDAMEGLLQTARLLKDAKLISETTRRLAEASLAASDAGHACTLLQELVDASPDDVEARILRTKALVRISDREQALTDMERIADLLPKVCRRRSDREAAQWCLGALSQIAPDRSDLVRRFRDMNSATPNGKKRVAIVGGLLLVCAGAGFALWPSQASGILERVHAAADRGDSTQALALISELADLFPNSPEYQEALGIEKTLLKNAAMAGQKLDTKSLETVKAREVAALASFSRWPDPAAVEDTDALATALKTVEGASLRSAVASGVVGPFAEAVSNLRRAAMTRRDAIEAAPGLVAKPPTDIVSFRQAVLSAKWALDPGWLASAARAAEAARRLGTALHEAALTPALIADLRAVAGDVTSAARAAESQAPYVDRAACEYHKALIFDAYERARIEAVGGLVRGDLAAAEEHYARLATLLAEIGRDPALRPLDELVDRRGIRGFSNEKTEMMRSIRQGIAAAKAAEDGGNLAGAASAYTKIVRQFPLVRFDEAFTIPVKIESVPPGAAVAMNGQDLGRSPLVVRYGWGSQAALTVTMDGYEPGSIVLRTADAEPVASVRVALAPARRWTQTLSGIIEAPPLGLAGDVVICTRSGRVERRSKGRGDVLWAVDVKGIEGVRGRPAYESGLVWVPLLDGRVVRVGAVDGTARAPLDLPGRPVGNAASLPGRVAFAYDDGVAVFAGSDTAKRIASPATISAGVLSAHGAFWVGDAAGGVSRVDAASLNLTHLALGGKSPVVGLAAGARAVLILASDGSLTAVDPAGASVLWRRENLGDVVGSPAEAAGLAAAADHAGRVHLFSASDGSPRGVLAADAEPRGGLIAVSGRIATSLLDGRLWILDAASGEVVTDSQLQGTSKFPAADLGDGTLAVPASGNGLTVVPVSR